MQYPSLHKIAKNKIACPLVVIFTGIVFGGFIILLFSNFGLTIATFCSMVIVSPFIAITIGDSRRLLWAILIVCLPITVDIIIKPIGPISGGLAGYKISLYDIVLAFAYLLWFTEIIYRKNTNIKLYPDFSLPAILLIFFACLSIIPSKYPNFGVYEIIEIIKMYLTFIYLANNIKRENDVQFIIIIFMVCLFFEGMLAWAQHRYSEPFFPTTLGGPGWIRSRVKGTWESYNDFGWYLTYFLPLALSMTFSQIKPIFRIICFFALAAGSGALMWTNSRASWISFGIAIIFVGLSVFIKIKDKRSLMNIFLTIMFIVIVIFPLYPRLFSKIYGRFSGDDGGSAASRIPQFVVAYNIIKDHPILGVGINNYRMVLEKYDNTEEGLSGHPIHNIFLHIAAEIGIPGLCIFLWFIAAIFYAGLSYVILNENVMVYAVIGMLAGILSFLIHGLVDTNSIGSKMFIFTWFFAGIIVAIRRIKPEDQHLPL